MPDIYECCRSQIFLFEDIELVLVISIFDIDLTSGLLKLILRQTQSI